MLPFCCCPFCLWRNTKLSNSWAENNCDEGIIATLCQLRDVIAFMRRRESVLYSISEVQRAVIDYIQLVSNCCSWSDEELTDYGVMPRRQGEASGGMESRCNTARKIVRQLDKPNIHRLYEFAMYTLPLTGHARVSQELSFEKCHAKMKHFVQASNKRNPHVFAMQNTVIDDWKARLSLAV